MAAPTGNRLLPALGVGGAPPERAWCCVRSCHWGERPGPTGAKLPKAPAADADSPAETLRSLTARVADMTTTMQALVKENQRLRGDNREMEATVTRRVTESLGREREAKESQALSELRRRLEDSRAPRSRRRRSRCPPPRSSRWASGSKAPMRSSGSSRWTALRRAQEACCTGRSRP